MKKSTYISPRIEVIAIGTPEIMAGSVIEKGNPTESDFPEPEGRTTAIGEISPVAVTTVHF